MDVLQETLLTEHPGSHVIRHIRNRTVSAAGVWPNPCSFIFPLALKEAFIFATSDIITSTTRETNLLRKMTYCSVAEVYRRFSETSENFTELQA